MDEESKKCEICGVKLARYKCAACGRDACPRCYWLQFGLCSKCAKK